MSVGINVKMIGQKHSGATAATPPAAEDESSPEEASALQRPVTRGTAAPVLPMPKRRARWGLLAAGVLAAVVFAVGTYTLVAGSGERTGVVGLAAPVAWGQVITRADLVEVQLAADPALRPVAWSRVDSMVGQRAAADLPAGTLLTGDSVEAAAAVPESGQALVGVQVNGAQAPTTPLSAGDRVALVHTSGTQVGTDVPASRSSSTASERWTGTVFAVSAAANRGERTVDVLVDGDDADALAQASAAGEVAIVVLPRS